MERSNKNFQNEVIKASTNNRKALDGLKVSHESLRGNKEIMPKSFQKPSNKREIFQERRRKSKTNPKALKISQENLEQNEEYTQIPQPTVNNKPDTVYTQPDRIKADPLQDSILEGLNDVDEDISDEFFPDWREFFDPVELKEQYENIQEGKSVKEALNTDSDADTVSKHSKEDAETYQQELTYIQKAQADSSRERAVVKPPVAGGRVALSKITRPPKTNLQSSLPRTRVV